MAMIVKAMVDKEKNRIVFAESDGDFADVLFSFMTIPMGTIVSLTNNENLPTMPIGCMNKLYKSVQNLDVKYFRTQECKNMLFHPRNGAPTQCSRRLEISIVDDHSWAQTCYYCRNMKCLKSSPNFYQNISEAPCLCGTNYMKQIDLAAKTKESDPVKAGAFLKGLTRLVITDDLQLMHPTNPASFSFLSELGVMDAASTALEVKDFHIGRDEVIHLLRSSLVSKQPLTQTLLKKNESFKENLLSESSCSSLKRNFGPGEAENGKIRVKLFVSKSKKRVCFAEVGEEFIDLLLSFLTIPLGHVLKQLKGASNIEGCVDNLYRSVEDLDVEHFKSGNEKEVLLNPKLAPKYGYENQLLGVEEESFSNLYDPKLPKHKEDKSNGGFMVGPAMFTVTDDLSVIPISAISRVTVLNKLDVPLGDIQEHIVHVGNKEAVCLLVAAFSSESALTRTFLQK